eukprot:TRINITY_DN808_c0_g2_i1.p1 TRINITY_DN808_c0_g2~~TRINITY_DN808_c0_g2_i1.p1  ORF type:complete len:570 (-),score=23.16 TRINITY_DN808_c0_g2_i1:101-1810(-)
MSIIGNLVYRIQYFMDPNNVNIISEITTTIEPELIELNRYGQTFALSFLSGGNLPEDFLSKYINVTVEHTHISRYSEIDGDDHYLRQVNVLGIKNCVAEDFAGIESEFKRFRMKTGYCVNASTSRLQGSFLNDEYDYIRFSVRKCRNNATVICESDAHIKAVLSDVKSLENTLKKSIKADFTWPMDPILTYTEEIFMKKVSVIDRKGIIFKEDIMQEDIMFDSSTPRVSYSEDEYLNLVIQASSNSQREIRLYRTIFDLLADIGGFKTFVFFFFGLFGILYNERRQYEDLLDKTFVYDPKVVDNLMGDDTTSGSSLKLRNRFRALFKSRSTIRELRFDKYSGDRGLPVQTYSIAYTWADFWTQMVSLITRRKRNKDETKFKEELYRVGRNRLEKDLDIVSILETIYDVRKLKIALLTEEQRLLFNTVMPPDLYVERKSEGGVQRIQQRDVLNEGEPNFDCESIVTAYRMIQSSKKEKDRRLLEMISAFYVNELRKREMLQSSLSLGVKDDISAVAHSPLVNGIVSGEMKEESDEGRRPPLIQDTVKQSSYHAVYRQRLTLPSNSQSEYA